MGSCVLRETIRQGRPRFAPRVSLSIYLSIYLSIRKRKFPFARTATQICTPHAGALRMPHSPRATGVG